MLDFDILQPIWSIRYSEPFSTCFQTKFHFRNIEFVNNLVRYDFGSVISVSVIFFRFSVFRYFGKNTVSVEHYLYGKLTLEFFLVQCPHYRPFEAATSVRPPKAKPFEATTLNPASEAIWGCELKSDL